MTLSRPSVVRVLAEELGLRPGRALGQNFLTDANILGIIVEQARLSGSDHVLEVGPGLGVLTERLLASASHVTAVEMDSRLIPHLRGRFADARGLTLIHGDALKVDLRGLVAGEGSSAGPVTALVSNLPYAAGTRILMEIFGFAAVPERMVVTLQREVAERIVAAPGGKDFGLLAVWAQRRYHARVVKLVAPRCFWPPPAVTSAVVVLERRADAPFDEAVFRVFKALTRHAFAMRRKKVEGILHHLPPPLDVGGSAGGMLAAVGAVPGARPENLGPDQWYDLARRMAREAHGA